jgi:hypothetical protein
MRGRQFIQLLDDLRDELDISSDPAVGSAATPGLKRIIKRQYQTLYDVYDWPHLRQVFERITLNAGQRYYDFPEDMDYDKLEVTKVWWGGLPHDVTRGIGFDQYAVRDSENDERSDPVTHWDVRKVGNKEMLEVWPMPSGTGQAIQFIGKTKFRQLVDDADLCLIDDELVLLYAAAEKLPAKKRGDVNLRIAAAQARLGILKANSKADSPSIRMGLSGARTSLSRGVTIRVGR